MKVFKNETYRRQVLDTYDTLLDLWGTPKQERDVATFYGSTHIITFGDKSRPPLVLFHGVGDNSALMWLYNAKALSKHFCVYAVDTIGGPGKSRPNENYNKDFDDIRWIDEVLHALSLKQCHAAGVSHGAYLVQYYAAAHPERFDKIVCMAGSLPVGTSSPMKNMMKIFLPEALFPNEKNTAKLLRKLSGKNSAVFTENAALLEHYSYLLKGFNNMAMRYHKLPAFEEEQIRIMKKKALYLMGQEDPFVKLGAGDSLHRYHMNAQFYPAAGHGINHEIADEINRALVEYLLCAECSA